MADINATLGDLKNAEDEFLITSLFNSLVWSLQKLNWILGDNSKFNQGVVPIIAFVSLLEQVNKEIQVQSTQPLI